MIQIPKKIPMTVIFQKTLNCRYLCSFLKFQLRRQPSSQRFEQPGGRAGRRSSGPRKIFAAFLLSDVAQVFQWKPCRICKAFPRRVIRLVDNAVRSGRGRCFYKVVDQQVFDRGRRPLKENGAGLVH